jgi:hypothetical protein
MLRKYVIMTAIAATSITGFASVAQAQGPFAKTVQASAACNGIADRAKTQQVRLNALEVELSLLGDQLSAATQAGDTADAQAITARIDRVKTRIATVQANRAKLTAKCPSPAS